MKKRPKRSVAKKPPPARSGGRRSKSAKPARSAAATAPSVGPLEYKVIELSTVDEGALERTINAWVRQGWTFDGVQFAMRESSKRPAMAFVLFTREGAAVLDSAEEGSSFDPARPERVAQQERGYFDPGHAAPPERVIPFPSVSPEERLRQLAEDDSEEGFTPTPSGADRWLDPDE